MTRWLVVALALAGCHHRSACDDRQQEVRGAITFAYNVDRETLRSLDQDAAAAVTAFDQARARGNLMRDDLDSTVKSFGCGDQLVCCAKVTAWFAAHGGSAKLVRELPYATLTVPALDPESPQELRPILAAYHDSTGQLLELLLHDRREPGVAAKVAAACTAVTAATAELITGSPAAWKRLVDVAQHRYDDAKAATHATSARDQLMFDWENAMRTAKRFTLPGASAGDPFAMTIAHEEVRAFEAACTE